MAQAESQPAPGHPEGRRRPRRHGPGRTGTCRRSGRPRLMTTNARRYALSTRWWSATTGRSSRHGLAYGAGMARRLNRPLLIVHVCPAGVYCEPLTGQVVGVQRDREELEHWLVAEFDQIADRAGLKVSVLARRGNPARELAATADEQGANTLVIGAPTRRWHHVARSVPGWLARHAHCPVMVVP